MHPWWVFSWLTLEFERRHLWHGNLGDLILSIMQMFHDVPLLILLIECIKMHKNAKPATSYIQLPDTSDTNDSRNGWLNLGIPPRDELILWAPAPFPPWHRAMAGKLRAYRARALAGGGWKSWKSKRCCPQRYTHQSYRDWWILPSGKLT